MIYIGIDPGEKGYLTSMEGDKLLHHPMPLNDNGEIDGFELANILLDLTPVESEYKIGVEDVHAIFGASAGSTFSFGYNVGELHGVLQSLDLDYELIQPKAWQAEIWKGFEVIKVPSKSGKTMVNDTKAMSKMIAASLFPEANLKKPPRGRKPHDGLCDSLLVAEYMRRKYKI